MIARLVRSADFERVLKTRTRVHSAHFAVHYLADSPQRLPIKGTENQIPRKLSTAEGESEERPVDDLPAESLRRVWLGAVVPKRHAKRSVTRTLLKRQIRAVVCDHAEKLEGGVWVVRLRAPFDRARFHSAASDELRSVARAELESLLDSAAKRRVAGA